MRQFTTPQNGFIISPKVVYAPFFKKGGLSMSEYINETGARLAALRKEKGLTQKAVAEKLGVNETTINAWEVGKKKRSYREGKKTQDKKTAYDISNAHLCALADLYGVSIDYILCRTDYKSLNGADIARITGLSDSAISVLLKYTKPEDQTIDAINAVVEDYGKNGGSSLLFDVFTYVFSYPGILISDSETGHSLPSFAPNADAVNDLAYTFRRAGAALNRIRNIHADHAARAD